MPDFSLNKQQQRLAAEITSFAQEQLGFEHGSLQERWRKAGKIGLPGLVVPKELGGHGLGALDTAIGLEALGYGGKDAGFNFAIAAHLLACVVPVVQHGTPEQQAYWLPGMANGRFIATNGMTEKSAGSDVYSMKSQAIASGDDFILNGHKTYCSNGPVADLAIVYALTNKQKGFFGGISAFVLEKEQAHFVASSEINKAGLKSCPLGEIHFDNISLTKENLLGATGAGGAIFQQSMEWERICLGALHLGEMERLMRQAVKFARGRKSGGKSLAYFQAVAHPLAELQTRIVAGRQLLHLAAWKLDNGKKVASEASMAKLFVSELYRDFALQLQRLYAGAAYREDHEVMRLVNDAMAGTIYSGTSEIQKNVIARYLGLRNINSINTQSTPSSYPSDLAR